MVQKSDIPRPALPEESIEVPELGGMVLVRGLLLSERLRITDQARTAAGIDLATLLASTVLDDAQQPVYTRDEWEIFGGTHFGAVARLVDVASRLCGFVAEAAEKN